MKRPTSYRKQKVERKIGKTAPATNTSTAVVAPAMTQIPDALKTAFVAMFAPFASTEHLETTWAFLTNREAVAKPQKPLDEKRVISREQLARVLRCGVRNIDYHRRAGHLDAFIVRIPGSSRIIGFSAEAVDALVSAKEVR